MFLKDNDWLILLLNLLESKEWSYDLNIHVEEDHYGNRCGLKFELSFILGNREVSLTSNDECEEIFGEVYNW